MKYLILFVAIIAIMTGCAKIYAVEKSEFNAIPIGSKKVIATSQISADSAFKFVSQYLVRNGWVVNSNKELRQITTDAKSIGAGTLLKPIINIEPSGSGSVVTYRGEWGLDQDGQIMMQSFYRGVNITNTKPIVFEKKGTTKSDVAFQALLVYAKRVPDATITFSK